MKQLADGATMSQQGPSRTAESKGDIPVELEAFYVNAPATVNLQEQHELEPEPVWRDEVREQVRLMAPIIFTCLLEFVPGIVGVVLVGHMSTSDVRLYVDAAALSTTFSNISCLSMCFGLSSALDTLCSQAHGAQRNHQIGAYLQAGGLVVLAFFVPTLMLNWFSGDLLLLLGQDPEVSRLAGEFSQITVFGMPSVIAYEMLRKVLQAQQVVRPIIVIALIGNSVQIVAGIWLTYHTSMGFHGAALSKTLGYTAMFVCLVAYVLITRHYRQWWTGWDLSSAKKHIRPFLRLGLPGLIMTAMEGWAFESLALMCGLLPDRVLALSTHTVLLMLGSVIFMVFLGISITASIRVGNALGANRPKLAHMVTRIAVMATVVAASTIAAIVLLLRYQLPTLLINDRDAIAKAGDLMVIFVPFLLFDGVNYVLQGVCRGAGRQRVAAISNAIAYYVVGLPTSALLAFVLHLGVAGIWLGCCVAGTGTGMLVLLLHVHHVDWPAMAQEAYARTTQQ